MRFGLVALLALASGAFAAHFLLADRGYVLVNFRGYVVEMSVPGLVLVLTFGYLALRALGALWRLPSRFTARRKERRGRKSGEQLSQALVHLTEGDWARGERLLTKDAQRSDAPLVSYLLAARAAQLQGAHERRDAWLELARQESPSAEVAVLLTRAELELEALDLDGAAATLERIERLQSNHPAALALLTRLHRARNDRKQLAALLPRLEHARLGAAEREDAACAALAAARDAPDLGLASFDELWASVPPSVRGAPQVLALRAAVLARLGRPVEAERELRLALKKHWHPALLEAYGALRGPEPAKQLRQAESWLAIYPEDGTLLCAAARLSMTSELWGKARSYLESSLALAPAPETYALYGELLSRLGEHDAAAQAFRAGLGMVTPVEASLPALKAPHPRELAVIDEPSVSNEPLASNEALPLNEPSAEDPLRRVSDRGA